MKSLLLFLSAFGFQITTGNVTVVQTCPETKTAWDYRSSIFTCEDGIMKYHCVMTSMWYLVEVCITPMNITGNEKGCPLVYILESAAIWVSSFTPCPVQNKECPQDGHRGYSTEQLYTYPPCFRNISERTSEESDLTQTTIGTRVSTGNSLHEEACKSDTEYLPYTTVAMFLLLASIHVFIILLYWKIGKVEGMIQEGNKRTSYISSLSSNISSDIKEGDDIPPTRRRNPYETVLRKKVEGMIQEGNKRSSYISSSSSNISLDIKESDDIPLTRRRNPYETVPRKKVVKGNDDPSPSFSDLSKGTSSTLNYESPVEKDVKVNADPSLPVSDSRKGTSSTCTPNYESPVEKGMKGNDAIPLSDSDSGTRATYYENYPVQKDLEGSDDKPSVSP